MARWLPAILTSRLPRLRTIILSFIVFCILLTAFFIYFFISILFNYAIPVRRAYFLETEYLYTVGAADLREILPSPSANATSSNAPQKRVRGLIEDVPQLHNWRIPTSSTYDELLGLWFDGLGWGEYKGKEYWIYFGGTHASTTTGSSTNDTSVFRHRYKKNSCEDPPEICDAYNEAFNRISARWHDNLRRPYPTHPASSTALLRYVNCDISPLLCSRNLGLGIKPVQIAHIKIGDACDKSLGTERCPVTWRLFGLPRQESPWTRTIRIALDGGGSTVVPSFPDAEEQMWTLMSHAGAIEGVKYYNDSFPPSASNPLWSIRVQVDPIPGEMRAHWSQRRGLGHWGTLRAAWLSSLVGMPRELLVRCYLVQWLDMVLNWWDGPPHVAHPQNCKGIEAKYAKHVEVMGTMNKLINEHGVDPKNLFVA
ncbi:hypothetical protein BDV96DRAFT_639578 [Lophiotrema nucula]|uniref:Uncharacterized protein n=1 Tax=Lophiotrema nucula TaxID=690887 RepID=A0A6A5ZXB7_9PLEO|nr:hypothetical protein BDV96DRAFT_639578 [Lophiotrema nucula]